MIKRNTYEAGHEEIDFVVTWVDGQDETWRQERARYSSTPGEDNSECRFRDWGLLKYWFRGVEKFAPWVRRIHFVTWGHLPQWLDITNPKLNVVRHEDYIPKEFLPTFNSRILEIYMNRINGLSEHFVYFNDDMFLIRQSKPEHFFKNGKPCDMLSFQPIAALKDDSIWCHAQLNNILILSKYFNKRENVKQQPGKYFYLGYPLLRVLYNILELRISLYTGLYTVHGPSPFCRETFQEIWDRESEALTSMTVNRFRSQNDLTPYLFREWQKLSGNFCAKNVQKDLSYYGIAEDNRELIRTIQKQKSRVICINDTHATRDIARVREEIQAAFQHILPEPSSFELTV